MLQKCWWNIQFMQKLNVSYHFCLRERQFLWAKNSTFWVWFKTSKMISIFALPAQGKGAKHFLEAASSVWMYFGIGSVRDLVELHLCWKMNISEIWGKGKLQIAVLLLLQRFAYKWDFVREWKHHLLQWGFWPEASTIYGTSFPPNS